jgi:hypothetical protein
LLNIFDIGHAADGNPSLYVVIETAPRYDFSDRERAAWREAGHFARQTARGLTEMVFAVDQLVRCRWAARSNGALPASPSFEVCCVVSI